MIMVTFSYYILHHFISGFMRLYENDTKLRKRSSTGELIHRGLCHAGSESGRNRLADSCHRVAEWHWSLPYKLQATTALLLAKAAGRRFSVHHPAYLYKQFHLAAACKLQNPLTTDPLMGLQVCVTEASANLAETNTGSQECIVRGSFNFPLFFLF